MTPEAGTRRRLHRAAILAEGLDALRAGAVPIVVLALVGGGGLVRLVVFAVLGVCVALVSGLISWSTTRWWVDDDSIRLRTGLTTERIVSVPLERVQAIDTVRGPAQRLLGGVEVHVQTAGGGARGEIVLKAVDVAVAEQLRGLVRAAPSEEAVPAGDLPSWSLRPGGLVVAALTSGSLGVLVPVLAGASQVLDDVLGADDAQRLLPDTPREWALAVGAVLGAAWVLSVLGTLVAFTGFRVTRDRDRLRIRRGVIVRREASVPVRRIAAIRILESPLREPFGLAQVRIESAGYASEPATAQALLPLVRRRDADAVVRLLLPELAGGAAATAALTGPPPRALRRYMVPPLALAAPPAIALLVLLGAPALPALALPLLAVGFGVVAFRTAGWSLDGSRMVLRRRGLQRTTLVADATRLPQVFARTSPLQRRAGLATLGVAVASKRRAAVAHLEAGTVRDVLARLTRAATTGPPRPS